MDELKSRTARSGLVRAIGQFVNLGVRLGFLATMARLLDPADFGVVAMVAVVVGIFDLLANGAFTMAAVQKTDISEREMSQLFWFNFGLAFVLAVSCLPLGPILVKFYSEPRLLWLPPVFGLGLLLSAAGSQHLALMQREIRYIEITGVDVLASLVSTAVAIAMALSGYGYWSLVAGAIVTPAVSAAFFWFLTRWIPSWPDRVTDVRALVRFGSTVIVNNLLVHAAYNAEKVLLGRYWGAEALGLYGRASQLISIPTSHLNGSIGGVAFAALARVQHDRLRFKRYFLTIYFVVISLTAPVTLFSAAFAPEVIVVALGSNWAEAIPIFLMLTPTVLIFGIINPMAWLLQASGRHVRSLAIACAIVPICLTAYVVGIPYGPTGVAIAYSVALTFWLVPHLIWCLKDTPITFAEIVRTIWRPILAACIAAALAYAFKQIFGQSLSPLALLLIGGCVMFAVYTVLLLVVFGGWSTAVAVLDALGLQQSIRRRLPAWVGGIEGRVIPE